MRNIIVKNDCDRAILYPQPTKWTFGVDETVAALTQERWDQITLMEKDSAEGIAEFLRDHPEHCPPRVVLSWGLDPILQVKIKLWLVGKACDWDAESSSVR
jgi:hypothetical protein